MFAYRRVWCGRRRSGTYVLRVLVCSDHSNTVKEGVSSLPRYAYVHGTEISPIVYEVRPDDGGVVFPFP